MNRFLEAFHKLKAEKWKTQRGFPSSSTTSPKLYRSQEGKQIFLPKMLPSPWLSFNKGQNVRNFETIESWRPAEGRCSGEIPVPRGIHSFPSRMLPHHTSQQGEILSLLTPGFLSSRQGILWYPPLGRCPPRLLQHLVTGLGLCLQISVFPLLSSEGISFLILLFSSLSAPSLFIQNVCWLSDVFFQMHSLPNAYVKCSRGCFTRSIWRQKWSLILVLFCFLISEQKSMNSNIHRA